MNTKPQQEYEEAGFDIEVLMEAMRLIKSKELPRNTWTTWDVFAGRNIDHEEDDRSWTIRVLREARQRIVSRKGN